MESKPRGEPPFDRIGTVFDITISGRGTPRFSEKLTKIVEAKLVESEIEGDFAGTGTWAFEPPDERRRLDLDGTLDLGDYRSFSSPLLLTWGEIILA